MVNMENSPTWVPVVALALFDDHDRVLVQQRPKDKHHGGLWEFPGGKVENGEDPRGSLVREIEEELALRLDSDSFEPAGFAEEHSAKTVVLFLYTTRQNVGSPEACEGQNFGWFTLQDALQLALAPMDRRLLDRLIRQKEHGIG